jgi:hypothetical protein
MNIIGKEIKLPARNLYFHGRKLLTPDNAPVSEAGRERKKKKRKKRKKKDRRVSQDAGKNNSSIR